ncbi:glucose-6-phosphatase 2 [Neocloeon triangulifer]|uniref:glucose-6-phosphatase 2 n=1 Tax=Neocloeon triangulifer TaxID=2078957 RepID=UPI00286ED3B8|nr:glucose-6-phosphatase 2 [Neocloeon triangulifer]
MYTAMDYFADLYHSALEAEVHWIHHLQKSFPNGDHFFQSITETANPYYAFSIFFPVFSVLSPHLAAKILMTATLSEWINALLKWLLMGHRPFWWVREILEENQPLSTPKLRQTPLTCETGPGNPSGHVMSYASICLLLVFAINEFTERKLSESLHQMIKVALWAFYAVSLVMVSLSRLYVAAHFPHQCLIGAIIGVYVGYQVEILSPWWLNDCSRRKMLKGAVLMIVLAFAAYWLQRLLGVNPQWSVKLAFKWCNSPDHVHVATTPIFALTRDCGTALGLALSIPAIPAPRKPCSKSDLVTSFVLRVSSVLAVLWVCHVAKQSIPTKHTYMYFLCFLLLNACIPVMLLVTVPSICSAVMKTLFGTPKNKKE